MKNKTLADLAEAQKAKLDANMQDAFERIYLAGMDFMYKNDDTSAMSLKHIQEAKDIPTGVGEGVAMIIMLLLAKSRMKMPMQAGISCGYALVCEGLDFVEQKGMLKVDNAAIDEANSAYAQKLMNQLRITDAQVAKMNEHAQRLKDDPNIKGAYEEKFGAMLGGAGPAAEATPAESAPPAMPGGGLVGEAPMNAGG